MIVVARRGCGCEVNAAAASMRAARVEVNVRKRIFVNASKCSAILIALAVAALLWGTAPFP